MENNLPKNWIETELGKILKLKNGYAFKAKDYREEGIPLIRIGNIQQGNVSTEKSIYVDKNDSAEDFVIDKGDVLVAMSGATTGKYGVFNEDIKAYQNQRVGNLKPFAPNLTSKQFIYYLLGGLQKEIEDKAYGGAQPNISSKLIETIKIDFPPLAEQQRIVTKLDELFGHLDSLKKRLENIPILLKNLKQAILTQAVTGKLTQEWRVGKELNAVRDCEEKNIKANNLDKKGWVVSNIKDYLLNLDSARVPLSQTVRRGRHGKYPYYGATGIIDSIDGYTHNGEFILISEDGKNLVYRTKPIAFLAKGKIWVNNHAHVLQVKPGFNNLFTIYFFNSINLTEYITGIDQLKLSQKNLNLIPISIPSKEEQTEIVKRVENLFTKADKIETQYLSLKTKIDSLPQAILAKAFKGELVEQLDTDGDAKELLAEIQALKESLVAKPKKKVVRKKKK